VIAYIYLENGVFLQAKAFGASGTASGEMVFNTSLTGYQEIMSDPSYAGQFIVFTMPEIGIVGVNEDDMESDKIHASGVLMRDFNATTSNFRSQKSLEEFFKEQGKFGVYDIDTRFLTKMLRDNGALHAVISTEISDEKELKKLLENSPRISEINYVAKVSTEQIYAHEKGAWDHASKAYSSLKPNGKKVAVIDYGVKLDIIDKSGAWFSYKAAKIGQGRENAKAYLKEHSEISDEIVATIKNSIGLDKLISSSGGKDEDGESIEENTEE